jgi:hypothetical protein
VLQFPRIYQAVVRDAISKDKHPSMHELTAVTDSLINLLRPLLNHDAYTLRSLNATTQQRQQYERQLRRIRTLRSHSEPLLRATACALELLLRSFCFGAVGEDLPVVALALKDALSQVTSTPCAYVDLTDCHLIMGAIFARKGSKTREWFVGRLRNAISTLQRRGWDDPVDILRQGVKFPRILAQDVDHLWAELRSPRGEQAS